MIPMGTPNGSETPDPHAPWGSGSRTYYFTVKGRGHFPHDMLRYDEAWAVTGIDRLADGLHQGERTIILATHNQHTPTADRWASFGWSIVDQRIDKPEWLP